MFVLIKYYALLCYDCLRQKIALLISRTTSILLNFRAFSNRENVTSTKHVNRITREILHALIRGKKIDLKHRRREKKKKKMKKKHKEQNFKKNSPTTIKYIEQTVLYLYKI